MEAAAAPEPPDVEALEKKIKAALVVKLKEKLKAKEEALAASFAAKEAALVEKVAALEADREESDKDRHYRKKDSLRAFDNAMKQLEAAEAAKAALAERLGAAEAAAAEAATRLAAAEAAAATLAAGDGGAAVAAAVAEAEAAKEAAVRGELIAKFKDKLAKARADAAAKASAEVGDRLGALEAAVAGRDLCANQIFNPTSMCAYANVLTRALPPCFENSLRAIDSSKNQPNRLRFDRAREF